MINSATPSNCSLRRRWVSRRAQPPHNRSASLSNPCRSWPLLFLHDLGQNGVNPSLPTGALLSEMSNDDRAQANRHRHFLRCFCGPRCFPNFDRTSAGKTSSGALAFAKSPRVHSGLSAPAFFREVIVPDLLFGGRSEANAVCGDDGFREGLDPSSTVHIHLARVSASQTPPPIMKPPEMRESRRVRRAEKNLRARPASRA